jgi:starvation-inducible outer membrane lipoprotein
MYNSSSNISGFVSPQTFFAPLVIVIGNISPRDEKKRFGESDHSSAAIHSVIVFPVEGL